MPIYEFKCKECSKCFSDLRPIGDFNKVECPHCKSTNTEKAFSTFSSISKNSDGCNDSCPSIKQQGHGPGCGCCH